MIKRCSDDIFKIKSAGSFPQQHHQFLVIFFFALTGSVKKRAPQAYRNPLSHSSGTVKSVSGWSTAAENNSRA